MAIDKPGRCGRCGEEIGVDHGGNAVYVQADSGSLFVTEEGAVHKCPTLTREDEAAALKTAGEALYGHSYDVEES